MAEAKTLSVLSDLTLSTSANEGTPRGLAMLAESIEQCGVGRPIVVDRAGVVIVGHKTLAAADAAHIPITVVQTTGQQLVAVQRTDLDLTENPKARQLAYYDNRVSEVDLLYSAETVTQDLLNGVNVGAAFLPGELDVFTSQVDADRRLRERQEQQVQPPPAPPPPSLDADSLADAAETVGATVVDPKTVAEQTAVENAKRMRVTDTLVFDHYDQQLVFEQFLRRIRPAHVPGSKAHPTAGAVLVAYLAQAEPEAQA